MKLKDYLQNSNVIITLFLIGTIVFLLWRNNVKSERISELENNSEEYKAKIELLESKINEAKFKIEESEKRIEYYESVKDNLELKIDKLKALEIKLKIENEKLYEKINGLSSDSLFMEFDRVYPKQ